jgi:hypothetical protein
MVTVPVAGAPSPPQAPLREQRIGPYAGTLQDGRRGVGDSLTHRQQGGRSGQDRARGQRKHDDQSVPYAAGSRGPGTSARRPGSPGVLAELVKGKRDRR